MKTIFTILILSLFILPKAQWVELDPGVSVPYFSDVYAITPDIVVVVGANGTILKTADGGKTWVQKPSGTTSGLGKIQFPTPNIGYIIGADGKLLKTSDSGETWAIVDLGETVILNSISCVNENLIFISSSGNLIKSEDGGDTWDTIAPLTGGSEVLFVNNNIGFTWDGFANFLSRTENGGETWEETNGISPTDFIDENIGFYYSGGLYKSIDGGNNFELLYSGGWADFVDIFAINENNVWGILLPLLDGDGSSRGIAKISSTDSENYSETIAFENNPEIDMYSIHFADETTGYIVGIKNNIGTIWKNGTGINTMGTNEQEISNEIKVYPNPATNELNIVFKSSEKSTITLTDFSGKQIYFKSFEDNQIEINTQGFAKGTYILKVKTENKNFTKKIIIN